MNLGYTTTNPQSGSCGCKGTGSVCDPRKVKSISKVGDQAIIAFDDCSYISAPAELFDTKSICDKPTPMSEDCCQNLNERVTALESKQDKDTIFDPSALEARIAALEARTDNDTVFDPTALENRLTALESKTDNDTVYDDSALAARVTALESRPTGGDNADLIKRIEALECFKDAVMKGLITVNTASNEPSFKALNVNFTGECTTDAGSIGYGVQGED